LHAAALEVAEAVKEVAVKENQNGNNLPEIFEIFFKFSKSSLTQKPPVKDLRFREKFSLFGEACLESIANFYEACSRADSVLVRN